MKAAVAEIHPERIDLVDQIDDDLAKSRASLIAISLANAPDGHSSMTLEDLVEAIDAVTERVTRAREQFRELNGVSPATL